MHGLSFYYFGIGYVEIFYCILLIPNEISYNFVEDAMFVNLNEQFAAE